MKTSIIIYSALIIMLSLPGCSSGVGAAPSADQEIQPQPANRKSRRCRSIPLGIRPCPARESVEDCEGRMGRILRLWPLFPTMSA